MIKIIHWEALEEMKKIPNGSIDCIITDPPYNIARDNNFSTMWRAGIDFWEWDKWADIFSYIKEASRILNKNWSFIVFNDWKNLWDISKFSELNWFQTKDLIRLEKSNPMPRNRDRRYITDFEMAIWFTKKWAKWTFNRQDKNYQRPKFVKSIEKWLHPTQKNLSLMEDIIKIHTNEWDIILDCFMWSWTTLVACQNTNRNWIGIELDHNYYNIAKRRLWLFTNIEQPRP
jgi:site-specific DNA-methyltransferase (adenine-specific)